MTFDKCMICNRLLTMEIYNDVNERIIIVHGEVECCCGSIVGSIDGTQHWVSAWCIECCPGPDIVNSPKNNSGYYIDTPRA